MGFFKSVANVSDVMALFKRFPKAVKPLLEYHDIVLRDDPSAFSIGERELIAAYVSSLNGCEYCYTAHRRYAEAFGIDPTIFRTKSIVFDWEVLPQRLAPVLEYVRKLTLSPNSVAEADAAAVFEAGWDDDALFDVISICALYNFMNRVVEGSGIKIYRDANRLSPAAMRSFRYTNLLKFIGATRT